MDYKEYMNIDSFNQIKQSIGYNEGLHEYEEYFNSVILVLMIPIDGEYHLVFQKRNSKIRQGGEVCFPGGKVDENDKSLEQVAIRETNEEMGIPKDKIEIIGKLKTMITPNGVRVDSFVGIADVKVEEIRINPSEVESFFTLPISYFINTEPERYSAQVKISPSYIDKETGEEIVTFPADKLGIPERYAKPWGDYRYGIYVYQTDYGVIWGITSRIIYDFIHRLKKIVL